MARVARLGLTGVAILTAFAAGVWAAAETPQHALSAVKILALTAGGALPENIAAAVETCGVNFEPSESFREQLKAAGGTPEALNAIEHAKVRDRSPEQDEDTKQSEPSWAHFAAAGKLVRAKQYKEAEIEVNQAMAGGVAKLEAGFVMGEVLRRQEEWDKAAAVYQEILRQEPAFPEAETKLSFVLYRGGNAEEALRIAKSALAATPNNAEAHKNAALALDSLKKPEASMAEYREALRIKPDYQVVYYDMGTLLYHYHDDDGAIEEFKKALTLNPNDADSHFNMGLAYDEKHDPDAAIREIREAKRLSPNDFRFRQTLGSVLIHDNKNADAVAELRELEAMAPESAVCHMCLAGALNGTGDYEGAQKELQIAIRLDPANADARRYLGENYEAQEKYDEALTAYKEAEEMDPDSVGTLIDVSRILLRNNKASEALVELKHATDLEPGNSTVHQEYGEALNAAGQVESAKKELNEALLLDSENGFARLDLARIQEKQGDWPDAMENYRVAAKNVEQAILTNQGPRLMVNAPGEFKTAQLRFDQHLMELRAAGNSAEAAKLEARVAGTSAEADLSRQLDAAMEAGTQAYQQRKFDEAERSYQQATKLAAQMKPHDARLVMSLGFLSAMYFQRRDLANSRAALEQQVKAAEEVYGPMSPQMSMPVESLARMDVALGDNAKGEELAQRDLALTLKNSGEKSTEHSQSLMTMGFVFVGEKQYAKALPYFEHAVKNYESLGGANDPTLMGSEMMLCRAYGDAGETAKLVSCNGQLLPLMEKFYGKNNGALAPVLDSQSKALRKLGREDEAKAVEERLQALQQAVAGTN